MRISDGSSDVCSSDLMAGVVQVEKGVEFLQGDVDDAQIPALDYAFQTLPAGVEMYSLRGPLFFGAARSLRDALEAMPTPPRVFILRSEEHTSELQSLMRISYAVFCLKKKNYTQTIHNKIYKK